MKYMVEVIVTLKDGIRDPQGAAISTVLKRTGIEEKAEISAGKFFTLAISAENQDAAKEKINTICEDVLINPILENYRIGRFDQV